MLCSNLYLLSTISCRLSECLSEEELSALAADLVALSDMLANIVAHRELCDSRALKKGATISDSQ